ncbi:DUF4190 domain-containing protein [Actinoplanes sp. NEAU-A12]|uniref:DUF4190 domain-containing protein n=1 Tax=Actinoplanes sandaracinus TaxID=3045177 RepID=A0ABT6WFF0_9ACTN|nr:DUF4190 domain-containing protein [Actinoplanes sandaracinus]MDI6098453.1 DUF4190 domain-containing protein [Actinoplanes sandaracinus]
MTIPPPPPFHDKPPSSGADNTQGLISMILGIVSIPAVCCWYAGVPLAVGAIVLGLLGKKKAEQGLAGNRGQAIAGIATGASAIALAILLFILGQVLQDVDWPQNFRDGQ